MKKVRTMIWLLSIALGLGINILSLPQAINAQTGKENKQACAGDDKDDGEKLSPEEAKQAKITMEAARTIAINRVNGQVVEEDLEKENGRLQYAFDIRTADGKIVDVEIDAMTGEILKADDDDDDDNDGEKVTAADAKQAKISMEAARSIALKRINGSVMDEELEKENGRLQYAFDIRDSSGKIWDVEIDAVTGEVLQAEPDDDDDDDAASKIVKSKANAKN